MKASYKLVLLFGLAPLLYSCDKDVDQKTLYYPIDSLMQAQVKFLTASQAVLTKTAEIDDKEETNSFTPRDTTAWLNELDIFAELNSINKPINSGNYTVSDGVKDTNSNLTIQSFTANRKIPIVHLKIFYQGSLSKIRRIEALYNEENSLLKGSRLLLMEFQEIHNKTVLTSYSIVGGQKMFMGNPVKFSVRGTVSIP